MSCTTLDWNSIAEERLRLYAEATGGSLTSHRRQQIYARLLQLELTREDIEELIPDVFDARVDPVAQLA